MKCIECGGMTVPNITSYTLTTPYHVEIKELPCWKCQQCGETYLLEESMVLIEQIEAKLGEIEKEKRKIKA